MKILKVKFRFQDVESEEYEYVYLEQEEKEPDEYSGVIYDSLQDALYERDMNQIDWLFRTFEFEIETILHKKL